MMKIGFLCLVGVTALAAHQEYSLPAPSEITLPAPDGSVVTVYDLKISWPYVSGRLVNRSSKVLGRLYLKVILIKDRVPPLPIRIAFQGLDPNEVRRFTQLTASVWRSSFTPERFQIGVDHGPDPAEEQEIKAHTEWVWRADGMGVSPEQLAAALRRAEAERADAAERAKKAEAERERVLATYPKLLGGESVFLGADRKCLEQLLQTSAMAGLEQRKRVTELVAYGCVFSAPSLTPVEVKSRAGSYALVELIDAFTLKRTGKIGWVLRAWITGEVDAPKRPALKTDPF